jgi:uncharacterized protein with von Willebrand factor type A (vWA) domain
VSAGAVDSLVGFAWTLRAAGVDASPDRVHACVRALGALDPARRDDVYWAGRLTLCASAEDLRRYDRAFDAYFAGEAPHHAMRRSPPPIQVARSRVPVEVPASGEGAESEDQVTLLGRASGTEVLRFRDFAALNPRERAEVDRLLAALRLPGELRRTRRARRARRGRVDRAATVRALLRHGGEGVELRHRRPRRRPRRVVLLLDVSGSMSPYASALLRFAHATARRGEAAAGRRTEVFTFGTRLTRVTRELSHRDPDAAMAAVSAAIPDYRGGTRIGELLKSFLDRHGQRGMARGAVAVVLSDGWERGDPALLAVQMERLARLAHRVVWANPLKARPGYAPLAGGMAAALPHVDDFVEGHSLAALERLARVVAGHQEVTDRA